MLSPADPMRAVFIAISISICCSPAAVSQDAAGMLAGPLIDHVKGERFAVVTSLRGLPLGVRDTLQELFKTSTLDIADPDGTTHDAGLPSRRLVASGCAPDHHCLVHYERAGDTPTWRVMLFHWTPEETRFEGGGVATAAFRTIEDVQRAAVSGALAPAGDW